MIAFPNLQMGPETQPLTSQLTPPQEERKQPLDFRSTPIRPSAPPADDDEAIYRQHPPGGCPLRNGGSCQGVQAGGEPTYAILTDNICINGPTTHLHHPSNTIPTYGGRVTSRMDSSSPTNSPSGSPPPPIVGGGINSQNGGNPGDCCNRVCPNCNAGQFAPPAYEESLCHPVMPE